MSKDSDKGDGSRGEDVRTSTLLRNLTEAQDFGAFLLQHHAAVEERALSTYLLQLSEKRSLVPERVIKAAGIDRTYGHQIFNGTRRPSRDKVLQLAFGFGMSVDECQHLLDMAGMSRLYPKIKRDAAILFCLVRKMNFITAQSLLETLGLTLLGGAWQRGE